VGDVLTTDSAASAGVLQMGQRRRRVHGHLESRGPHRLDLAKVLSRFQGAPAVVFRHRHDRGHPRRPSTQRGRTTAQPVRDDRLAEAVAAVVEPVEPRRRRPRPGPDRDRARRAHPVHRARGRALRRSSVRLPRPPTTAATWCGRDPTRSRSSGPTRLRPDPTVPLMVALANARRSEGRRLHTVSSAARTSGQPAPHAQLRDLLVRGLARDRTPSRRRRQRPGKRVGFTASERSRRPPEGGPGRPPRSTRRPGSASSTWPRSGGPSSGSPGRVVLASSSWAAGSRCGVPGFPSSTTCGSPGAAVMAAARGRGLPLHG